MNENPTARPPSRHSLRLMIAAAVLLIAVLVGIAGYLEKWLWMQQLDLVRSGTGKVPECGARGRARYRSWRKRNGFSNLLPPSQRTNP